MKQCTHVRENGSSCLEYTRDPRNKTDATTGVEWAWFLCSRCDAGLWAPVKNPVAGSRAKVEEHTTVDERRLKQELQRAIEAVVKKLDASAKNNRNSYVDADTDLDAAVSGIAALIRDEANK